MVITIHGLKLSLLRLCTENEPSNSVNKYSILCGKKTSNPMNTRP